MDHRRKTFNVSPLDNIGELNLLQWYRRERRRSGSRICECECGSGAPLSLAQPDLIRAFMFVAASIDEAMRRTLNGDTRSEAFITYTEFRKHFGFPRIEPHCPADTDFVSPNCLIYDWKGVKRLTDWSLCAQIAENLILEVREWARTQVESVVWNKLSNQLQALVSTFEEHDSEAANRVAAALKVSP